MSNKLHGFHLFRRILIILSSSILLGLLLIWFIVPAKAIVMGIFIGGLISFYNVLQLARRVETAGLQAISGSTRPVGSGMLFRLLMIGFGIILAYRLPHWIDYRALILGLLLSYILMIFAMSLTIKKEKTIREGRDVLGTDSEDPFSRSDV